MAVIVPITFSMEIADYFFEHKERIADGLYLRIMDVLKICHRENASPHVPLMALITSHKNSIPRDLYLEILDRLLVEAIPRRRPVIEVDYNIIQTIIMICTGMLILVLHAILIPYYIFKFFERNPRHWWEFALFLSVCSITAATTLYFIRH